MLFIASRNQAGWQLEAVDSSENAMPEIADQINGNLALSFLRDAGFFGNDGSAAMHFSSFGKLRDQLFQAATMAGDSPGSLQISKVNAGCYELNLFPLRVTKYSYGWGLWDAWQFVHSQVPSEQKYGQLILDLHKFQEGQYFKTRRALGISIREWLEQLPAAERAFLVSLPQNSLF